jgi:hypothetical protein
MFHVSPSFTTIISIFVFISDLTWQLIFFFNLPYVPCCKSQTHAPEPPLFSPLFHYHFLVSRCLAAAQHHLSSPPCCHCPPLLPAEESIGFATACTHICGSCQILLGSGASSTQLPSACSIPGKNGRMQPNTIVLRLAYRFGFVTLLL